MLGAQARKRDDIVAVQLKILGGSLAGVVIQMQHAKFLIGREQDCLLRPDSPTVSRHHCVLLQDGYTLRIRDLGSKNGTYVNGRRVNGEVFLSQDDMISVGEITMQVEIVPAAVGHEGAVADETINRHLDGTQEVRKVTRPADPGTPEVPAETADAEDTVDLPPSAPVVSEPSPAAAPDEIA